MVLLYWREDEAMRGKVEPRCGITSHRLWEEAPESQHCCVRIPPVWVHGDV